MGQRYNIKCELSNLNGKIVSFSRFSGLKLIKFIFNETLGAVGDFVAGAFLDFDVDFAYVFADDAETHEQYACAEP